MKVIIVEDEYAAANNLVSILNEIDPKIEVVAIVESVKDLCSWIKENETPHLGIFDIQLADTNVFEVFRKTEIKFPVIFTTAYSEYAINAFKVNSIDYILKPLNIESVKFALDKYKARDTIKGSLSEEKLRKILMEFRQSDEKKYKQSFLVQNKERLIPVEANSFSYFYIDNGLVYGVTLENKRYMVDYSLDEIENQLDPEKFVRANRQYIVNRKSIVEIALHFNAKYSMKVAPPSPTKIIMSKSKSARVRKWIDS
jgi:DNA-binding LytR/AlgR family response regulator